MANGRTDEQDTPLGAKASRCRIRVWGLFGETHLGQRSCSRVEGRTHDRTRSVSQIKQTPCAPGAVHTCITLPSPRSFACFLIACRSRPGSPQSSQCPHSRLGRHKHAASWSPLPSRTPWRSAGGAAGSRCSQRNGSPRSCPALDRGLALALVRPSHPVAGKPLARPGPVCFRELPAELIYSVHVRTRKSAGESILI